jgi:hypothetical protein
LNWAPLALEIDTSLVVILVIRFHGKVHVENAFYHNVGCRCRDRHRRRRWWW